MNITFAQINQAHAIMRKCEETIHIETGLKVVLNMSPAELVGMTPEDMLVIIVLSLGMRMDDYSRKCKKPNVVTLRFLAATFLRHYWPKLSLKKIASYFGGQDHTTIVNALKTSAIWLDNGDSVFTSKYYIVKEAIEKWLKQNEKDNN